MREGSNLCARICVGAASCFSERFFHICRKRKAPRLFSSTSSSPDLLPHLALHPLETGSPGLLGLSPHPVETGGTGFYYAYAGAFLLCHVLTVSVFHWIYSFKTYLRERS